MVWRITVDFVGACENKYGLGCMAPGEFEEIERAVCIHRKIGERFPRRPVMRGLRCSMQHQGDMRPVRLENRLKRWLVPDINVVVPIPFHAGIKLRPAPSRACLLSTATASHI